MGTPTWATSTTSPSRSWPSSWSSASVWEFVYQLLMQFRWEKDWPTLFGYLTGINEGILVYVVADKLGSNPGHGVAGLSRAV